MITRSHVEREARRQRSRQRIREGDEIRRRRLEANVSQRALAAAAGIHHSHLARLEAGETEASIEVLTRLAIALGCELSVRLYAGVGPRLQDRFQASMLEGFLSVLHDRWRPTPEHVVPAPTRGVVDLSLSDRQGACLVLGEFQSELRRLEQQVRWLAEKARAFEGESPDGTRPVGRLLILRSTAPNRELARSFEHVLAAAYPARAEDVWASVTGGADWPGDGVLWIRPDGAHHVLMPTPPRGVGLGR